MIFFSMACRWKLCHPYRTSGKNPFRCGQGFVATKTDSFPRIYVRRQIKGQTVPFLFFPIEAPAIVLLPCIRLRITRSTGFHGVRNDVSLLCANDRPRKKCTTDVRSTFLETPGKDSSVIGFTHFCRLKITLFYCEKMCVGKLNAT